MIYCYSKDVKHLCAHNNHSTSSLLSQLTWTAYSTAKHVSLTAASQAQEVVVSYLPLSHIAAQMVDIWIAMKIGGVTYFAQPDALKVRHTPQTDNTNTPAPEINAHQPV